MALDEPVHLAWFSRSALPTNTIPYVSIAVRLGFKGVRYSEFGWPGRTPGEGSPPHENRGEQQDAV